jgi:hypothetical protein
MMFWKNWETRVEDNWRTVLPFIKITEYGKELESGKRMMLRGKTKNIYA